MSSYLRFDVGSDRDVHLELIAESRGLAAQPVEYVDIGGTGKRYRFSIPCELKSQLEKYLRHMLRRVDEMDVDRCEVELRHVLAHIATDGTVATGNTDCAIWSSVNTGFVAAEPGVTEVDHVVIAPKRGDRPMSAPEGWSVVEQAGAWQLHSRKRLTAAVPDLAVLRRDREKIAHLFKDIDGITISSTVELVVARWTWPFEPAADNRYRTSMRRRLGVSDRHVLDFFALCAEIRRNHDYGVGDDERRHSDAIATLEPCRRIALAQGVTPLLLALGMIPMIPASTGPRFADYFCTRAVSYEATREAALSLVGAFDELIYLLVNFGHSPILSAPGKYDQVFVWTELLNGTNGTRSKPAKSRTASGEAHLTATSERVLSITPSTAFRRLDETARKVLAERLGSRFDVRNLGIIGVPFRTIADSGGTRIGGCLFALVSAPNLDRALMEHVAMCQHIFLHRAPFKLDEPRSSAAQPITAAGPPVSRQDKEAKIRKQQALEHNQLWNALESVWEEPPGTRLDRIARRFPADHAVYLKYEAKLQKLEADIETATKLGKLMKQIWSAITGTSEDYLWQARKLAGLPSRKSHIAKKAQAR
jgi:hypothetical protein